jgi:8-oxo-dGTP pyrophosphatase MutT (NUDIX family)
MRSQPPYGQLVARRLREARTAAGLSQSDVAERMQDLGFRSWLSQTVSSAERGKRRVTIDELLGLMVTCQTDMQALIYPAAEYQAVSLPAGQTVILPAAKYAYNPDLHTQWDGNRSLLTKFTEDRATKEDELQPVAVAIVTSRLGVLVGRRHDGKPPWTFIAGEVEPGEDAPFAAGREVKEETGLEVEPGGEIGRRIHPKTERTMIYIAAKPVRPDDLTVFVGDERELAEVRWVSLAEADELMASYGMFEPVREHLAREIGEG